MRKLLKNLILNFFTLLIISKLTGAINFSDDYLVLFWSSLLLLILNKTIKPILNLLLMPINLITLGAGKWIVNLIVLLIIMLVISSFRITSFNFKGFSFSGFTIPVINLPFFWSLILVSLLIEVVSGILIYIFD